MGRVRRMEFDAVIGVGGIGHEAKAAGISGRVNWIGIGATKIPSDGRGPIVGFVHFVLFDGSGPEFRKSAPVLAGRMYRVNAPRYVFDETLTTAEKAEVRRLLRMVRKNDASKRKPDSTAPHTEKRCRICC